MSPSVATRTWGDASTTDRTNPRPLIIFVALGLLVAALLVPKLALPTKVPTLTIDNPSAYTVTIEASNGTDSGWSPVAVVPAQQTTAVTELNDEGPEWSLRFTSQGSQFTGYEVRRSDLAASGWHYSVPDDVAVRLQAQGASISP